jgi:asparagine synthase (glutamine-hydrolysing)
MDVTGAVELYVNNLARGIAPIRLTGNYGSEILRSQLALKPRDDADVFVSGEMKGQMATARDTYAVEFRGRLLSFIAYKQVPWHHFGRFAIERSQVRVRSPFLDNDLVSLAYQAPDESLRALEPSLIVIAAGNPRLASIPTDRGVVYPSNVFVDGIRRRWHDFMAKVEYAFDYGMPQWLAGVNRACGPLHLDQAFLGIQKFYHFRGWYQRELRKYVQDVLLDERTLSRPYLNRKAVERLVDAHVQGRGNYTMAIHKLLTSEIIQRKLIEQR